jgi:LmbE family N-acetylglucosaminyl deacetylase
MERYMPEKLKLLAIFPHPDVETLGMGPTLAKYSAEGVETYLVCATRGERGWKGPEEQYPGLEALGRIRTEELNCAAEILGIIQVDFLDYLDGDLDQADPQENTSKLVGRIRRIQPQVVVTFSLDGNYGHPDHIALAQFTAAALVCSADLYYPDASGEAPTPVSKFYHMVDSKEVVGLIRDSVGEISMFVDNILRTHIGWEDWAITSHIEASAYFD